MNIENKIIAATCDFSGYHGTLGRRSDWLQRKNRYINNLQSKFHCNPDKYIFGVRYCELMFEELIQNTDNCSELLYRVNLSIDDSKKVSFVVPSVHQCRWDKFKRFCFNFIFPCIENGTINEIIVNDIGTLLFIRTEGPKVQMELPYCLGVFLFNYGEPLLSPDLPRMIHEIHSRGMIAIISSNLSLEYNFDSLLIDPPDIFKISISGFSQKVYETTHNGGNIYLVKSNMYRIRMIEDKLKTRVNVVVGYHVYNNNQGAEYIAAEDLCKELGFLFQPRKAIFCNIPKQAGIDPFSKSDIEFISEYYPNSRDILTINQSKETISGTCRNALNRLFIDYNGDVFLCFMVMHNGGIYKSYLQTSLKDIRMWQKEHWICGKCKDIGFISLE